MKKALYDCTFGEISEIRDRCRKRITGNCKGCPLHVKASESKIFGDKWMMVCCFELHEFMTEESKRIEIELPEEKEIDHE